MTQALLRKQIHLQEVEKKIKLLQMNWFIKNHEEANKNIDGPKPTAPSAQTIRLINEIQEMRTEIKDINVKLEEYQKEINTKDTANKPDEDQPSPTSLLETDISYMYPVPPDVKLQLYNGINIFLYY